jgi:hypothetical protein
MCNFSTTIVGTIFLSYHFFLFLFTFARASRKSEQFEIINPYLAEYILDMAECEEACSGISLGSPFLFEDSQSNLFSSDSTLFDRVVSYEAFSHIQSLPVHVYFI